MVRVDDLVDVSLTVRDRVALVTLDRPEARNAFSGAMAQSLGAAYQRCDEDDDVRVVVVTGAGTAFCVGADLTPRDETFAAQTGRAFTSSPVQPPAFDIRKPVIAAVNGHAVGIGLTLAMQCDLRILARGATYGFVHVRRGVIPDAHSHWTVPRAVGFARATELLLTGRHVDADEAVSIGLANRAVPADEVLPDALTVARDVAVNTAPLSVAISKRLLWSSPTPSADEVNRLETAMHEHVMGRADAREGVLAFLERREPRWSLSPTRDWPDGW